jgi:hypothetical protein
MVVFPGSNGTKDAYEKAKRKAKTQGIQIEFTVVNE